jgi:hypothetical protein
MPLLFGGTYYDTKLFTYQSERIGGNYSNVIFRIYEAETGILISAVPREELYGTHVVALAYDYTTNAMYALHQNALHTIDLTTGELTSVAPITGFTAGTKLITMGCHLNGTLYVINSGDGNLYTVNKTTGVAALVGTTGIPALDAPQSMGFDHSDGTLYWCQVGGGTFNFVKVNITTGLATMIQANTYQTTSFFIPYDGGAPEPEPCDSVTIETFLNDDNQILITWNEVGENTVTVFRNGAEIASNISETSYLDENPIEGENCYEVQVVCTDTVSSMSNESCQVIEIIDIIHENTGLSFSIAPNPANSEIAITAINPFNRVEIINHLGQTVLSQQSIDNKTKLDISHLSNGIYFVRIISEKGESSQKFVKQ